MYFPSCMRQTRRHAQKPTNMSRKNLGVEKMEIYSNDQHKTIAIEKNTLKTILRVYADVNHLNEVALTNQLLSL